MQLSECEVFEYVHTATLKSVLDVNDGVARVLLLSSDLDDVQTLGAVMVDQGVFEKHGVPIGKLDDHQIVQNNLQQEM